jgi:spore coat-associated protein N
MTATAAPSRTRRVLVPLATLLAAAGIVVASGATFSTSTASTGLVASGVLQQTNSNSVAFSGENLKPGDVVEGTVTITNDGTLPAIFTLTESEDANSFFPTTDLTLEITEGETVVSKTTLGAAGSKALGEFAVDESRTYAYRVTFLSSADNAQQNKRAETTYTFSSVQTAGETFSGTEGGKPLTSP